MVTLLSLLLAACHGDKPVDSPHESGHDSPSETGPVITTDDSSDDSGGGTGQPNTGETAESAHSGHSGHSGDSHVETGTLTSGTPYVILFIGDGMGFEHVQGGGDYAHGAAGTLTMETLPYQGRLRTASLTGITDSAAAATSYASGQKTWNDVLGLDRDGASIETLVELAKSRGMSTGVVTTDILSGATPAAFLVHVESRYDGTEIATQEVANLPDVLMGGGSELYTPMLEGIDVQLVTDVDTLTAATLDDRPLVGLFAPYTMPFVATGLGTAPTLAQMTTAAISKLETNEHGFFLMVEGARIDHASHLEATDEVHPETASFDDAISAAMSWAADKDDVTMVVTADHECGGLKVGETGTAGEIPDTTWRWGQHTNADVPVLGMGDRTSVFDGQRLDALWIYAVLDAAIEERDVEAPSTVPLIDGWLDDLGDPVTTQTHDTDFGAGYDQLDGLRVTADEDGIRVGVDGVFDRGDNTLVLLFDMDYGDGTGMGGDGTAMPDDDGVLEAVLDNLDLDVELDGLGFDIAMLSLRAREVHIDELQDESGVRGLRDPWAYDGDLWWLHGIFNIDDGNIAMDGDAAPDAASTGTTEYGMEALLPWYEVWPDGFTTDSEQIAVVALLVNSDGTYASNQVLPPLDDDITPGYDAVPISSAALITVDGTGTIVGDPEIVR